MAIEIKVKELETYHHSVRCQKAVGELTMKYRRNKQDTKCYAHAKVDVGGVLMCARHAAHTLLDLHLGKHVV